MQGMKKSIFDSYMWKDDVFVVLPVLGEGRGPRGLGRTAVHVTLQYKSISFIDK